MKLLDLEHSLEADGEGALRDRIVGDLTAAASVAKRRIDQGLAPAEYGAVTAMKAALDAACEVVPKVWQDLRQA